MDIIVYTYETLFPQVFVEGMVSTGPWCSKSLNITVTLTVDEGYEYNSSNPGYQFTLAIYNKCGDGDSITYEEAIKHLDGE